MKKLHMQEELMLSVAIVERNSETQMIYENIERNVNNYICESRVTLEMIFNFTRRRLIIT